MTLSLFTLTTRQRIDAACCFCKQGWCVIVVVVGSIVALIIQRLSDDEQIDEDAVRAYTPVCTESYYAQHIEPC